MRRFRMVVAGLLLLSNGGSPRPYAEELKTLSGSVQAEMAQWVEGQNLSMTLCLFGEGILAPALLSKFYQQRGFTPIWVNDAGLSPKVLAMVLILENADAEGLRPEDYHAKKLRGLLQSLPDLVQRADPAAPIQAATAEVLLTDAFLAYGHHLAMGRTPVEEREGALADSRQLQHLEDQLLAALAEDKIFEFLDAQSPKDAEYVGLKIALRRFRDLAQKNDWPFLPAGPPLKSGDSDPARVPPLRVKLRALGDLGAELSPDEAVMDDRLIAALQRFQTRTHLAATGQLTEDTLALLNRPLSQTVRQLELNLERWRWLPRDLGQRFLLVNIPAFELTVKEDDETVMVMKVVVGKQYRNTPVFASKLLYLVLDPTWSIPTQIILKEKLPAILRSAAFFRRNHITVIKGWEPDSREIDPEAIDWHRVKREDYVELYRFRQEPGPWNALGRVKFVMPNPYDVYLHDTPNRELFDEPVRDFSHGCIRLEKPLTLAEYLLDDPDVWTRERLEKIIRKNHETIVDLPAPVPVYVSYLTAVPGDDGLLYFYPDIYGRDQEMSLSWEQPTQSPCISAQKPQGLNGPGSSPVGIP